MSDLTSATPAGEPTGGEPVPADAKPTLKQRWEHTKAKLKALFDAYGPIAFVTWFAIFGLVLGGFYFALSSGLDVSLAKNPEAGAGTFTVAYLATQATKPLRALATLVLTPFIAKLLGREPKVADEAAST